MNGLKNGVVVNSFDLPSNDPAGGVHLTLQTTVTNVGSSTSELRECIDVPVFLAVSGGRAAQLYRLQQLRRRYAVRACSVQQWFYPCPPMSVNTVAQ
jgi:hypothetical protein